MAPILNNNQAVQCLGLALITQGSSSRVASIIQGNLIDDIGHFPRTA